MMLKSQRLFGSAHCQVACHIQTETPPGLAVQSQSDCTYSVQVGDDTFAVRADQLLRELHDRVLADSASFFDHEANKFIESPNLIGLKAREAIYYGADSFYLHQFSRFSRAKTITAASSCSVTMKTG
jgi:hypothetical protein